MKLLCRCALALLLFVAAVFLAFFGMTITRMDAETTQFDDLAHYATQVVLLGSAVFFMGIAYWILFSSMRGHSFVPESK
jgi:hypothetical protein